MKILILDFLRRWWWMVVLCALFSIALGASGLPFVFAPAALVCLIMDAQRGVFRTVRMLPIRSRAQATAWWFIAVPLLPLLSIPAVAIGAHLFQAMHPPAPIPSPVEIGAAGAQVAQVVPIFMSGISPWFVTAVQGWVALGYAGFCFCLVLWLPTRPPEGAAETAAQMVFGALWGMSIPALMFILPNMPKVPANITPWHCLVFAAAPVCFVFSLFAAPDVMQRRTVVIASKARQRDVSDPIFPESGLTGVSLLIANFFVRFMAVLTALIVGQLVFSGWMSGRAGPYPNPILGIQAVTIAVVFAAISGEAVGLRVLRMLPLSTMRLAWLIATCPLLAGCAAAGFTALFIGIGDPALPRLGNFAAQALAFSGCGVLAVALTLYIVSGVRLLVLMVIAIVPAVLLAAFPTYAAAFAFGGAVTGPLGFALLLRGLRKSGAFYQPRRILGIGTGQPMAVR